MNYFQRSISIQNILKTFLIVISVFYLNPSLGEKKDFVFYLSCEETEVNMDSLTKEMTSKIKFSLRIKRQNANDYNKRMDIKDPIKIALRYINSQFAFDLLAIIPFNFFITIKYGYGRLFYLVKLLRLFKGFQILNVANIMTQIKLIY